jgi:hypothetical protein
MGKNRQRRRAEGREAARQPRSSGGPAWWPDDRDPLGPQKGSNLTLRCLRCGRVCMEWELKWACRNGAFRWYCPTTGCDGAGIGIGLLVCDPETGKLIEVEEVKGGRIIVRLV